MAGAEYLFIKDTVTGKTLQVIRQPLEKDYLIIKDGLEAEGIRKMFTKKIIRTWMKRGL